MTHYDITQWTDFVRELVSDSERRSMAAHLEAGCKKCSQTVSLLASVAEVARVEAELSPPEYAVRAVKSSFRLRRPDRRSWLEPIKVSLLFDSALVPAPVGVRNQRAASRQLLYSSQDYALDLRLDYEHPVREMVLLGEVLNRKQGPLADVPAFLMDGEEILSSTFTGKLGEFSFRCPEGQSTHLKLLVENDRCIDLAIERRADEGDDLDADFDEPNPGDPWAPQEPS